MKPEVQITPLFGSIFAAVPVHENFEKCQKIQNFKKVLKASYTLKYPKYLLF